MEKKLAERVLDIMAKKGVETVFLTSDETVFLNEHDAMVHQRALQKEAQIVEAIPTLDTMTAADLQAIIDADKGIERKESKKTPKKTESEKGINPVKEKSAIAVKQENNTEKGDSSPEKKEGSVPINPEEEKQDNTPPA